MRERSCTSWGLRGVGAVPRTSRDHGPFGILGTGKSRWAKITAGRGFEAGGFVYYLDLENGRYCFVRRLPAAAPSSGALRWRRCSGIPVDCGQSVKYSSVNPPATRILKAEVRRAGVGPASAGGGDHAELLHHAQRVHEDAAVGHLA